MEAGRQTFCTFSSFFPFLANDAIDNPHHLPSRLRFSPSDCLLDLPRPSPGGRAQCPESRGRLPLAVNTENMLPSTLKLLDAAPQCTAPNPNIPIAHKPRVIIAQIAGYHCRIHHVSHRHDAEQDVVSMLLSIKAGGFQLPCKVQWKKRNRSRVDPTFSLSAEHLQLHMAELPPAASDLLWPARPRILLQPGRETRQDHHGGLIPGTASIPSTAIVRSTCGGLSARPSRLVIGVAH